MILQGLSTNQESLTSISYLMHRLKVINRTAPKSHVSVLVSPSTVSPPVCCVLAVSSPTASLAVPLLIIVTDKCQDWPWPYRPQKGRSAVLQAQRTRAGWLARAPSGPPDGKPACMPAWVGWRKTVLGVEMTVGRVYAGLVEERGCKWRKREKAMVGQSI